MALGQKLGIHSLPSYLIQYGERNLLIQSLLGYAAFVSLFEELTDGTMKPQPVNPTVENLQELLDRHSLISPLEIREAFDLSDTEEVRNRMQPFILAGQVRIRKVFHGWFIEKF